ncbi:MAG: Protein serine/threonine phosphatase PrpC, regulation of stationary phase [Nitrospira sp.]|jgi:protein phosphatase|nr:MAG: Protein serine/threonine phosphatase PrpC, regulation of stationary phase [Nitrospira sp.]
MSTWIGIGRSEVGLVRALNQDAFAAIDEAGIWAVADGMGGHVGGEVAAQTAIATVRAEAATSSHLLGHGQTSPTDVLTNLISRAHDAILNRSRSKSKLKGMGTTIVLLAIMSGPAPIAYIAHVGDSRAYRFRSGMLIPLTKDHSLIEKYLERGILTAESAKTHPERHVLTRALGIGETVNPTITAFPILPEDLVLLCSDGLTKMLEDEDIRTVCAAGELDPTQVCNRLVNAALDRGGEDNVTVVVVASRSS